MMQLIVNPLQEISLVSPQRIEDLVNSFILSQDVKQSTKVTYRASLKQYFGWVTKKAYLLSEIARPQIIEYKEELLAGGMSSLTVGSYINSVRRFYEWTEANKFYPNIAKGISAPKRTKLFKKQPLNQLQAIELLKYSQGENLRDNALINLSIRTGLRTIEVIRANVGDIVFKGSQRVLSVQGKGRDEKDNFVILTDKTHNSIAEYLATRGKVADSDPLFISTSNNGKGDRLTTRTIRHIVKEGLKAIGLNDRSYSAHSLRHTAAVNILEAGGTLEMVQFTLRHSNPATTQIYIHTRDEISRLKSSGEVLLDSIY